MTSLDVPAPFQRSYESYETYPRNILHQGSYIGTLQAYADRLDNAASTLLIESDAEARVPVRDLYPGGQGMAITALGRESAC